MDGQNYKIRAIKVWIVRVTGHCELVVSLFYFHLLWHFFLQATRSASCNPEAVKSAQWDSKVSSYAKKIPLPVLCRESESVPLNVPVNASPRRHLHSPASLSCSAPCNARDQMCRPLCDVTKGSCRATAITSSGSGPTHNLSWLAVCSGLWESCFRLLPNMRKICC